MFAYVLDGYASISYETVRKEFVDTFGEVVGGVKYSSPKNLLAKNRLLC